MISAFEFPAPIDFVVNVCRTYSADNALDKTVDMSCARNASYTWSGTVLIKSHQICTGFRPLTSKRLQKRVLATNSIRQTTFQSAKT